MGKQKTHEEYVKELSTKKPQIICLERYIKNNIKLKHKCLQCEYEWNVYPTTMTCTKSGCPKCLGLNKKTHEEYILELKNINPNFRCLDHYINNNTKIKHKCLQCTFIWNVKPRNLLSKHGCPNCKPNHKKNYSRIY